MCWLTNACEITTRVIVFFKSAPVANIGPEAGMVATAEGAYPRERRRITGPKAPARATESSTRRAMGRSPIRNASAMSGKTRQRVLVFIRNGLARAIGAGHHQRFRRAGVEKQVMQRSIGQHYAEFVVLGRDAIELNLRAGKNDRTGDGQQQRLGFRRKLDQPARPLPHLLTITANGFSLRYFRSRRASTAVAFAASHARW